MDPQTLASIKDASLVVQPGSAQTSTGTSVAAVNAGPNGSFDLAQGATLVNGQFAPGGGGQNMSLVLPITSYNAAQTLALSGGQTGGTFPITVTNSGGTFTTTALAYNATAAAVLAALAALPNVGSGNVTVTLSGSTYTITFASSLGVTTITSSATNLTGGAPVVTVTTPTYSFVVNQSPDGSTWQAASRVATVITTDAVPPGGGILQIEFAAKFRYLQLAWTFAGTLPSMVMQDAFVTPFINAAGI